MLLRKELFGEGGYTFRVHCRRSFTSVYFALAVVWTVGLYMVLAAFTFVAYFIVMSDYNGHVDRRVELVEQFEFRNESPDIARDKRRALASSVLQLDDSGLSDVVDMTANSLRHDKVDELKQALARTARTGEPLRVDVAKFTWGGLWGPVLQWGLMLTLFTLELSLFLVYQQECKQRREFLTDLPWRRVWPILFVLVAWAGAAKYIQDSARVRQAYRQVGLDPPEERVEDDQDTPVDLEEARDQYRQLRLSFWSRLVESQLASARRELAEAETRLREAGASIRELSTKRNETGALIRRLEAIDPDDLTLHGVDDVDEEFRQLTELHGVRRVYVEGGALCLTLDIRHAYQGWLYDAGRWKLIFRSDATFVAVCRWSGVRDTWEEFHHPDYRYPDGRFCFRNGNLIEGRMRTGDLRGAVALTVATMHFVAPGDRWLIPEAFTRLHHIPVNPSEE